MRYIIILPISTCIIGLLGRLDELKHFDLFLAHGKSSYNDGDHGNDLQM